MTGGHFVSDDRLKGKAEEIKGDVKQRIGGATKDRSLEGEGALDEAKGKARQAAADVKEKVKGAFKKKDEEDIEPDK
jgi:uncharacterized protein YjbJ (UPF0337 family)